MVPGSLSAPVMKTGEAAQRGFLIKKVRVPQALRKLLHHRWKHSSHQTFINYKKDKLLILLKVELSHSPSLPSSKYVFSKQRKCKMENIWFALLGSGSHRLPLQWKGAQKTALAEAQEEEGEGASEAPQPAGGSQGAP